MKRNWTKLLVVLLAMIMVLSCAACGNKNPDESKPESTPAGSSPTESNPASSPESSDDTPASSDVPPASSDPVGSESDPTGKDESTVTPPASSDPADTDPVTPPDTPDDERPTVPTVESYTKDEGENWVFELNKTDVAIAVDGAMEKAAYYKGVYLVAEIAMPDSGSYFDVFIAADDTHIYFFYEFFKEEQIFWSADYPATSRYHLDCVDFCLDLHGLGGNAAPTEFRIFAGVEGDINTAVNDASAKGVDALYVKHTENGYNVEFSIPLDKVWGKDANGDKMIAFTALSTITTAWDDPAGQPSRVYTTACCAAGALDKSNPTYLVVKGSKEGVKEGYTEDGRYQHTFKAASTALVQDGIKDAAYTDGLVYKPFAYSNAAIKDEYKDDPNNDYVMYVTADADYVWVFFEVKDSNIVNTAVNYWYNDCVEVFFNTKGEAKFESPSIRVWADCEGTDMIGKAEFPSHKADQVEGAVGAKVLNSYTLVKTEVGYNVEISLKRSELADPNMLSLLGVVTMAKDNDNRTYVYTETNGGVGENADKSHLNQLIIEDPDMFLTAPSYQTETGNNVYEITKAAAALAVDGVKDEAYANGMVLQATYNIPASGSYFNLYITADETHAYVLYEFIKNEQIYHSTTYTSKHHLDCADFVMNLTGAEAMGTELHILGGIEGGKDTADIKNDPAAAGADDWFVKHTDVGYNVEIAFPLEAITGTDANGDKVFSFTAVSTITYGWADPNGAPERKYAFVGNGRGEAFANQNDCKKAPNLVVIKGTATPPVEETPDPTEPVSKTEKGCNVYETVKSAAALTVDGVKDDAYADGIFLVPTFSPAANGTTYNFYMVADETHIYVLYEFDKAEEIFYDGNYGSKYHFDCADFLLRLDGAESTGTEFRIHGTKEGGKGEALVFNNADLAAIGVDDYYVKHTAEGYNVEFSIPLEKVTGTDAEGNKVISFTVMATVTEAYTPATQGAAAVISKIYPAVACGNMEIPEGENAANWIKARPNILVVKGTAPVVTPTEKPTAATAPTKTTEKGNYLYEINKSETAVAVDGILETEAYYNGLYLPAAYNLADDGSKFDVYFTADDEYIYVFYVFTKNSDPKVFAPATGNPDYKYDCVDFVLSFNGMTETMGTEFHIYGAFDSSTGKAYADAATASAGVESFYVKHTDEGYNVEFAIPLSKVVGQDANGDKVIGFTALSTVTTAADRGDGTPARSYTFAVDAIHVANSAISNNDAKKYPSLLVVKGTAVAGGQAMTADGRYTYTLNAGKTALAVDGAKDEAYANGISFLPKYCDGNAANLNEKNTFEVFFAADAEYVYVLYVIKDDNIVYDTASSSYWWFDCADFVYNCGSAVGTTGNKEFRIFGADGVEHKGVNATDVPEYVVVKTDVGYNVEFKLARSSFNDKNVFSCNPTVTLAPDTASRTYVAVENTSGAAGNPAKGMLNEIKIVDAQ